LSFKIGMHTLAQKNALYFQAKFYGAPLTLVRRSHFFDNNHNLIIQSNSVLLALKSRVEHIECHLVALCRASDSDKSLVAVVLRFVDLDHTATKVSDLVDLGTTLANNGTDHVVGDEDLLCDRLTWH